MKMILARLPLYLLPGLGDMLWMAAFAGVLGLGPRMMNVDGDLGRHLTIGRYILEHGRVPVVDLFSHTLPGQPLTPHEWLAQVIFALAHRLLGLDGVVLVSGLVIATSFWVVYRQARRLSQAALASLLVTVLAIAASSLHWLTRPHIFTFLLLALWLGVLEDLRCGRLGRWWLLAALMLLWANLHGAFIAGFVTWALFGLGVAWDAFWRKLPPVHDHFWRYYLLGGAAAFLASLANPMGLGLWGTSVGYLGNRYLVGHTAEYLPPNFQDPSAWPFWAMIGLTLLLFGLQSKRLEAARVLPAAAWLVMALYSARNIPLFAIVSAPLLAGALGDGLVAGHLRLQSLERLYRLDQRLLRTELSLRGLSWPLALFALAVLGFQGSARLDFQQQGNRFDARVFPVQAVQWLEDHPQPGRVFNYFPWGGYLLYRAWPDQRVFIDGQTDFYGEALTRQYEQALTLAPGWEGVFDQYQVGWALLPPGEPLAGELRGRAGWQSVYRDETAEVLVRTARP